MKFLALSMLLFAARTFASGCDHYDGFLASEKAIVSIGTFEASYECSEYGPKNCHVYVYNGVKNEYHTLYKQYDGKEDTLKPNQDLGKIAVHIFEQFYVSSCGDQFRYTLGLDFDGKRYREQDDMDEF